ncbi:hypothetical protein HHI36_023945 [Cryptolaemus montrouzieri]|uniref:Uncharacterized protein n=1 Tax=Cryptolaemus montrouzieri TaxID=559131 RepID=A0ABD2N0S0_9CUCU
MPVDFENESIRQVLEKYGKVNEIIREKWSGHEDFFIVESGVRIAKVNSSSVKRVIEKQRTEQQRDRLNNIISEEKVRQTLKEAAKKRPGLDSLPYEFYVLFLQEIRKELNVLNAFFSENVRPPI